MIPKLGHMPLVVKGAYALRLSGIDVNKGKRRTIMPSRFGARDESPCSATAMRKATRRMTQLYDDALAPAGLRSTQYAILEELHRQPDDPPTMGELAETLVLDRSALGHNVRPLERDGLIALVSSDDDRRRRRVVLTTTGHAKFAQAREAWKLAQDRFNDVFGESAAAKLRATLLRIARDERLATLTD
jgi:DNA-binding MarR family transcriptional regulator